MKKLIKRAFLAILLAFSLLFGGSLLTPSDHSNLFLAPAYADEEDEEVDAPETTPVDSETTDLNEIPKSPDNPDTTDGTDDETPESDGETPESDGESDEASPEEPKITEEVNSCKDQTGALSWIICPGTGVISKAVDGLYNAISDMLIVSPISSESDSPVYLVWQYARDITNIIFVIFIVIVILSQLTGVGLNNYGIKRVLPRIIIAVILVNLSFLICSIAVDLSNVIGYNLRGFFEGIQQRIIEQSSSVGIAADVSVADLLQVVLSGGVIGGVTISALGGGGYIFFMLLTVLIGALIAVVAGLVTISARHALISLLVMISPLAFVAYLLPNTEKWFSKWKELLFRMLIFFPIFSLLFGASQLIGWTLIASATKPFGIILGIAVQIFPLFFSWSLMKMSGTVLGQLNSGIRRLGTPIQRGLSGWSLSHAENRRQNYLATSHSTGAHLREYLDKRRELRELDTKNALDIRHGRATEYAFKTASSNLGLDQNGNMVWDERANRYTRTAKRANTYGTRAQTAQSSYATTLASYGTKFTADQVDIDINAAGSFAGSNAMAQRFLTANQAESDQKDLLDLYLKSADDENSYQYHRLISNAASALGHNGESSILGQVIATSSAIETRRRSEARIMINKFGVNKRQFRAMIHDTAFLNDDGYELDEDGKVIMDENFNILPGKVHREWQQYIGEHKITKKRLSKEQYDALSESERAEYNKIRYMNIKDDAGHTVATVFEDDAGYMKELLRDDIAIGDPINARYIAEIGVAASEGEKTGILRRYHSTIATALNETKYKEHNAAFTPMLTQQANNGYITSIPQAHIGSLQSFIVASKAGPILVNDSYAIDGLAKHILSADEDLFRQIFPNAVTIDADGNQISAFAHYFPDQDIANYRDVNGNKLSGYLSTTDENGNQIWKKLLPSEVDRYDKDTQLELRKNFLKHDILPKAANKLIDSANRDLSPKVLEEQKGPTLDSLLAAVDGVGKLNDKNFDSTIPFEHRINANMDLFKTPDRKTALKDAVKRYQRAVAADEATDMPGLDEAFDEHELDGAGNGDEVSDAIRTILTTPGGAHRFIEQLDRSKKSQARAASRNDHNNIVREIEDILTASSNYDAIAEDLISKFRETETLQELEQRCQSLIDAYRPEPPTSTDGAMDDIANHSVNDQEQIEKLAEQIRYLIETEHH